MHVSIYLFLASLYIHDMNNAVYVNQMADHEQSLKASFWKINHLHSLLSINQLRCSPDKITAEECTIFFLHIAGLTTGTD